MENVLRCECGFEVQTGDDAELVAQVQRHALSVHGMRFSAEDVLQLASGAELRRIRTSSASQDGGQARPNRVLPKKEET